AVYAFDPNRIFSSPGIKKTLEENGQYDEAVEEEVNRFADSLLSMLRDKVIVALHNNSNGRYSVRKYLDDLKSNAAAVHINEVMDEDDFIYTTSNELFIALRHLNINVVLQDHEQVEDDGSLSVYCGRNQIVYVNVETEHGHEEEQYRLTKVILNLLSRPLINK
nr:hypothetical protein [Flavisolibacter sp.]